MLPLNPGVGNCEPQFGGELAGNVGHIARDDALPLRRRRLEEGALRVGGRIHERSGDREGPASRRRRGGLGHAD